MSLCIRVLSLIVLLALPAVPARSQDLFQTLITIMNETAPPGQAIPRRDQGLSVVDVEVLEVQRRLSALGYDVGVPDGVMGPKTRLAIAAYQQSIGTAPTGELTALERDALFSGRPVQISQPSTIQPIAVQPMGVAPADFELLHDVDLPGNDFRSGMSEPSLRGGLLDGCMAACAADGLCQAFTFNAAARVCFLKTVGANPTGFAGAISGMRRVGGGIAPVNVIPLDAVGARPLSTSEVAQLQAGLAQRGYDAGTPDGVVGGRTRAAIARFLADNPGQASQQINVALLEAVLGQAAIPAPSAPVDPSLYRTLEEADRDFALIALAREPALLDDWGALQSWFNRNVRNSDPGANAALLAAYDNGNSVERETILNQYKQSVLQEAQAFVANPANLRLHIRITNPIQFGSYQEGRGLAISHGISDVLHNKRLVHRTAFFGRSFGGLTLDAPDIAAVPVADAAAAAGLVDRIETLSGNRTPNLTIWLTISEVGVDRNAVSTPVPADVPMTVSVDKVALMTYGRDGRLLGDEIAVLYLPGNPAAPPAAPPADNLLVAQGLSLPLIEGHLVVPGGNNSGSSLAYAMGIQLGYEDKLASFLNLAGLRLYPERTGDWIGERAMRALMDQVQHLRVYGVPLDEFYNFANEFDRRRALEVYSGEVVPQLIARAPRLPFNVVSITIAQLGEYDFATQSFPIGYPDTQMFGLPGNLAGLRSSARYRDLPASLPMDEVAAEAMVRASAGNQPFVYVAAFGTLDLPPQGAVLARPNGEDDPLLGALVFTPSRAGIFADVALRQNLAALDPASMIEDPDGPRLPPPPTATQLALEDIVVTTEVELLAYAYDRLAPDGLAGPMIESAGAVQNANEFDVAQKRLEVEQAFRDAARRPVWLDGVIRFGTYDTALGQFDAAEIQIQNPYDGDFSANYYFSLFDPRQLTNLAMSEEGAKLIVANQERRARVLAQVELVDISVDTGDQTPDYSFALDIKEMMVLTEDDGSGRSPELIARIAPMSDGDAGQVEVAAVPPLTWLDAETLDYLRLKHAPQSMTEAEYERMMTARWSMEMSSRVPEAEFFFPRGTDLRSAGVRQRWLPEFKAWAEARLPSLDNPLRLACANSIQGEYWQSPLRDTMVAARPDLVAAEPIERIASQYAIPHLTGPVYFEIPGYLFEENACGVSMPAGLAEAMPMAVLPRSGALIGLADAVMPGTGGMGNGVELAVIVEAVDILPHPQGGRDMLLVSTRFDSAWYPGEPPVEAASAADLETLLAARDADGGSVLPEGWDIVGLKPGQTLEEADAIIRAHMEVIAVYERLQGQRQYENFRHEVSYLDAALSEAITLIYEPTAEGDVVFLIARQVGKPADTMPTEDLLAGLRQKYGQERRASQGLPGSFHLQWHSQEVPGSSQGMSDLQHCGSPSVGAQGYWSTIEGGIEAIDPMYMGNIQVRGYMVLPGPSDLHPEMLAIGQLDCGVTIVADKHKTGNNDALMVQIFDYVGYAKAIAAAQELPQSDPEPAPALDIQF